MSATVVPLINGIHSPAPNLINEGLEYERILKLRDEIFAGSHPRLTVPAHVRRQLPQRLSRSHSSAPLPPVVSASQPETAGLQARREEPATTSVVQDVSSTNRTQPAASHTSEIDPILLTKSDILLKAESQNKRQRLEKALRDQFEQKRLDARKKPAPSEAKPDFDISALLAKALEISKHDPNSKEDGSVSDSFDENSFYSSRAPDSVRGEDSPDASSSNPSQRQVQLDRDDLDTDRRAEPSLQDSSHPQMSAVMGRRLSDPSALLAATQGKQKEDFPDMDMDDEEEEGEYSPPEATEQYPSANANGSQSFQDSRDPRSRPLRRYSELDENTRRAGSPSDSNPRINGRQRRDRARHGRQGSPTSPEQGQGLPPRKKRKVEKGNRKNRRNGGMSPDTFIKEENVSPPPFHNVQPLGSAKTRPTPMDRPIVIDDQGPVPEPRYVQAPVRYVESPLQPIRRYEESIAPPGELRPVSRINLRTMRDDTDLRRVASMHNMRAEPQREYVEPIYDAPTRTTSGSYLRTGSPMVMDQQSRQEIPQEYERLPPREVRVIRTPAPEHRQAYQEPEPEPIYSRQSMAPPPTMERIVIDQFGRKFREIIQPERMPAPTPRAVSVRHLEPETSSYDGYRQVRSGSMFVEPSVERRYNQEMPLPPQIMYRQVAEPPRNSAVPSSAMRGEFDSPQDRRAPSMQLMERPMRQPIYTAERGEYMEPMRMSSVRPVSHYENFRPTEGNARATSVRPMAREGSVFVEDRGQPQKEYVMEQPRYRVAEPEQRYYDMDGQGIITFDGSAEGRQRVVQRY